MTVVLIILRKLYDFQEQFYQAMSRLRGSRSRAASTQDTRVTEIINGVLVSKPLKTMKEPEIIDLQEYARSGKAASVQIINKVKVIADFLNAKRY